MIDPYAIAADIQFSLRKGDPNGLRAIESLSYPEKDSLRGPLRQAPLTATDCDWLLKWAWNQDFPIRSAARSLILLYHDIGLLITCCDRFLDATRPDFPYQLSYDAAQQEFSLNFDQTPGVGVSHYGRTNQRIDSLLLALERVYQRLNVGRPVPPWFRQ